MDRYLGEVAPYLPEKVRRILVGMEDSDQRVIREIRIKVGSPLLIIRGGDRRVYSDAIHTKEELDNTFRRICASSSYTHRNEIRSGYVTLPGGHRVGILGSAVLSDSGRLEGMRDIYGLVFRIARDIPLSVPSLSEAMFRGGRIRNLLIAGPPCSGKTTVLRSLCKALAQRCQVSVVDEREELFPGNRILPVGCDVLRGYPKAVGILQALRTLSPQVVICDEIGTSDEIRAMADGLRSGVSFVVSAHAFDEYDLLLRPPVRRLIFGGGVDLVAFLDPLSVGTVKYIKERQAFCREIPASADGVSSVFRDGCNLSDGSDLPEAAGSSDAGADSIFS